MKMVNSDPWLHLNIVIIRGNYKGLYGLVVNASEQDLGISLTAVMKTVRISRSDIQELSEHITHPVLCNEKIETDELKQLKSLYLKQQSLIEKQRADLESHEIIIQRQKKEIDQLVKGTFCCAQSIKCSRHTHDTYISKVDTDISTSKIKQIDPEEYSNLVENKNKNKNKNDATRRIRTRTKSKKTIKNKKPVLDTVFEETADDIKMRELIQFAEDVSKKNQKPSINRPFKKKVFYPRAESISLNDDRTKWESEGRTQMAKLKQESGVTVLSILQEPTSPVVVPTSPVMVPTSPVVVPTSPVVVPTSPVVVPTSPVVVPTSPVMVPISIGVAHTSPAFVPTSDRDWMWYKSTYNIDMDDIKECVTEILGKGDLTVLTNNIIYEPVQEQFGDLPKDVVRDCVKSVIEQVPSPVVEQVPSPVIEQPPSPVVEQVPVLTKSALSAMKVSQLKDLCRQHDFKGHSKAKKKADLVKFLLDRL
jgi:hypothetical protein